MDTPPVAPRHAGKSAVIADTLRRAILSGAYHHGALLPGEDALAQQFDVSRGTIRRVLAQLGRESLISTRTGVGSTVTFDGRAIDQQLGWGRALTGSGARTSVTVLRMEIVDDPDLAATLDTPGTEFLALDRLRRLEAGAPVSLERSRVPALGDIREVPRRGLINDSLTATLSAAGMHPARGEQWVSVAALSVDDAALLERAAGDQVLHSSRVTRDDDGRLVEKVVSLLDPQHFRIHLTFERPTP